MRNRISGCAVTEDECVLTLKCVDTVVLHVSAGVDQITRLLYTETWVNLSLYVRYVFVRSCIRACCVGGRSRRSSNNNGVLADD